MKPTIKWTRRKKTLWSWLVFAIVLVGLVTFALGPLVWQLSLGRPGDADFYLHQSKYKSIVTRVKQMPLAAGAQTSTALTASW